MRLLGLDALETQVSQFAGLTIADYLPRVLAAATSGQLRTYGTYWQRAADLFERQPLDQVYPADILALQRHVTR